MSVSPRARSRSPSPVAARSSSRVPGNAGGEEREEERRGGVNGGREDRRGGGGGGGYDDRRGGSGGYEDRRGGGGGYEDRRGGGGGYEDRRGGYDDRRGGGGYDDRRGGYDDRRGGGGGYDDRRGGGGYDDRRGGYDDRRGGYDDRRGGRGGYERGGGGYRGRDFGGRPERPRRPVNRGTSEERANSRSLYIGNLPYSHGEEEVKELFGRYGTLIKIHVPIDTYTQRNKGFCFVEYEDVRDCDDALAKLQGWEVEGRPLRLDKDVGVTKKDDGRGPPGAGGYPPATNYADSARRSPDYAPYNKA